MIVELGDNGASENEVAGSGTVGVAASAASLHPLRADHPEGCQSVGEDEEKSKK